MAKYFILKSFKKSFHLLFIAFKNAKNDFIISSAALIVITTILAFTFYYAEISIMQQQGHDLSAYNVFLWAVNIYIPFSSKYSSIEPTTQIGEIIVFLLSLLKILIFAVPSGLVATYLKKAIDDDKKKEHIDNIKERLNNSFQRIQNPHTFMRVLPVYKSVATIQVQQKMSVYEIIEAVNKSDNMRLHNIATTYEQGNAVDDRLVVQMFPKANTCYGFFINRHSNVTIVSTSSVSEIGTGHFAYYLAYYGGFNYISKELEPNPDEPTSYYIIQDETNDDALLTFIEDLKNISKTHNHWVIFILSTNRGSKDTWHIVSNNSIYGMRGSSVIDNNRFSYLYKAIKAFINGQHNGEKYSCELNTELKPTGRKNISNKIGGGTECNAFTLRLPWKLTARSGWWNYYALGLAKILSDILSGKQIVEQKEWKRKDKGFPI